MSDYPMLISNKLHSFRNFARQRYATSAELPNYSAKQYATKKGVNSICLHPYSFIFFKNRFVCYQFAISEINLIRTKRTSSSV